MEDFNTTTYQEVFFAHQPIFDSDQKVWGYEIYFRDKDATNCFFMLEEDRVAATREILSIISLCPDKNLGQARVVVNCTEDAILKRHVYALHPETTVVQLGDNQHFHPNILREIRRLKEKGYTVSIDDYQAFPENIHIYRSSDVMTLNVLDLDEHEIRRLLREGQSLDTTFLAKKIETRENFTHVRNLGFRLFQGYFFKEPQINKTRKVSSSELIRFEILEQLCSVEVDFQTLSEIISKDSSLSMRLINLLNSPVYGLRQKITSLKQATVYVGLEHLQQWLRIIILTDIAQPQSTKELLRVSLLRAKFLENIAKKSGMDSDNNRLFLIGLFSLLDSMYQLPMQKIMGCLSALDEEIRNTLLGKDTELAYWLQLAISMENSDWSKVGKISANLSLDPACLMPGYLDALQWTNHTMEASTSGP